MKDLDDDDNDNDKQDDIMIVENEGNIRVEIPVNPASEILGNFWVHHVDFVYLDLM